MIVSDEYKFVYYDIPKTGSVSLDNYFRKNYNGYYSVSPFNFLPNKRGRVKHNRDAPKGKEDFIKIASVRDPYERAVSMYFFTRKIIRELQQRGAKINLPGYSISYNFDEFLDFLNSNEKNNDIMLRSSQTDYMSHEKSYHVLHLESLEDDLKKLPFYKSDVKFPLRHENMTAINNKPTPKWKDMYNESRREKIIEFANEDFEKFGYEK